MIARYDFDFPRIKITSSLILSEANIFYQVFKEQPELAEFLRKLEALQKVLKGKTTVIFDTNVPPFDLLKPGAENLTVIPRKADTKAQPAAPEAK